MTFKMIKPGITILALVLKKLTIVVAMLLIVAYIAGCEFSDEPTFYPTLEQAFLAHSGVNSRRMPDILFLDEVGNSLTAFHPGGGAGAMMISHYIRELRDGEYWFACLSVASGGISIGFGDTSIEASQRLIHDRIADDGFDPFDQWSRFHTRLGRRPLLGFSPNPNIRNLTINGVLVDYVIETTNAHGAPLFFWYYSDFPPIYGEKEDIIICLEPNQSGADREICLATTNSVLEDELDRERDENPRTQGTEGLSDWARDYLEQRKINSIEHIIRGDYTPANRNVDLRTIERFVFYVSAVYCSEMTFVIDIMHGNVYYHPVFTVSLLPIRYSAEFRNEDLDRLIEMIEASGMRYWEVCYLEEEVLWEDCALIDGGFGSDWGVGILFSDGTMLRSRGCNVTHPPEEQFRILTEFVEKMSEEIIERHNTEQGVVDGD